MHNNHIKKLLTEFFVVSFFFVALPTQAELQANSKMTLTLFNWSEYMDPDLIKIFENKHNIKIQEIYFETDDTRDEKMLDTEGQDYDIIIVNGAMIGNYVKRGWLAPITTKHVANLKHINKKWLNAFPAANGYAVPYFWGTLGIAYRTDLLSEPITSWRQLFEPSKQMQGKILMIKSARDIIGMALKSLGYSINSENVKEVNEARNLLEKQKLFVSDYSYFALNEDSALAKGTIVASMAYNGDAIAVQEVNNKIAFVIPDEGTNIWVDYLVVSSQSKYKEIAYKFIDYITQPRNAAKLAQLFYFASPNISAEKYLPKDFLQDETIYPNKNTLDKSEFFRPLPARVLRKYNSIFSQIVD